MMKTAKGGNSGPDRLTVSLGTGQRMMLEEIASLNGVKLAYVVRYALSQFIEENQNKQIALRFPMDDKD